MYVSKVTKVNTVPTNTSRAANNQPVGDFGGYGSAQEFAQQDPVGFTKHLEETVDGYIK